MAIIYYVDQIPDYWVVNYAGVLWLVPIGPGGWRRKRPYRGHREALKPVAREIARLVIPHCGIPEEPGA